MKIVINDYFVEQYRSEHVPFFKQIKNISESKNVICCSISGSGPSVFSLVEGKNMAKKLKSIYDEVYIKNSVEFNSYVTPLNAKGVRAV